MLTKTDFDNAIANTISNYPELAARYHARDPIILQHLEAIAAMLAMLAQSTDAAVSEAFLKSRDATVLADAAMRGIVPKAKPARAHITVTNKSVSAIEIEAGRLMRDSRGMPWVVVAGTEVAGGSASSLLVEQRTRETVIHTVARYDAFYPIEVPLIRSDGQKLAAIEVRDESGNEWAYSDRYTNAAIGDQVYHVEADERRRIYVRFGAADLVGVQPPIGARFTLILDYCHGAVAPDVGSPFVLSAIAAPQDAFLTFAMDAIAAAGQDPISLTTLRKLARYPSVYNTNAVYLGEFDALVRRSFPSLRFLSVWNERLEEKHRGVSVENINTLFVAVQGADQLEPTLTRNETIQQGEEIASNSWTSLQHSIAGIIARADDSYRVRFFTPLHTKRVWRIDALIGSSYAQADVAQRIRERLLSRYGVNASSRGGEVIAVQDIYADLRANIPEIAEPGADITVTINDDLANTEAPPETWRYLADDTLTIVVNSAVVSPPSWGW